MKVRPSAWDLGSHQTAIYKGPQNDLCETIQTGKPNFYVFYIYLKQKNKVVFEILVKKSYTSKCFDGFCCVLLVDFL